MAKVTAWYNNWKLFLLFYLPAISLIAIVILTVLFTFNKAEIKSIQQKELHTVSLLLSNVDEDIFNITSDLLLLSHAPILDQLLNNEKMPSPSILNELNSLFISFITHRKLYDQIRFLDNSGMEIARVNYNNGHPSVVPDKDLQNKKGRYYFDDTLVLGEGEVFVSPLDLNIEHGQIEEPLKPMLRVGTPVFDQSGIRRGILLLNYLGTHLINHINELPNPYEANHLMLLNSDGYWLKGPNPKEEWGFMYKDRKDLTFAKAFPLEWNKIQSTELGQFTSPNGLFSFSTAYPLLKGQHSTSGPGEAYFPNGKKLLSKEYKWKLVSRIPTKILESNKQMRNAYGVVIFAAFSLLLLCGTLVLCKAISKRKRAENALTKSYEELEQRVAERTKELRKALDEVKTLRGIIPICSYCKKIRDDRGSWNQLEAYIHAHSEAEFSHGACPECYTKQMEGID